ncbi:glycosyltransferase domain-containing protein [uncultured Algoriphagus sp.]|uniref:glycosyltransferase domain-containing protein n=1 Tax=uncultured Algoriphagus sp. TaxID=417365 RepID=UPI0030EC7AF2|tara:strand:- start:22478 stop:23215 length:738 start_codon:yes stop_codon:yes gene_type:complete
MKKWVIYTALFGDYDQLREPEELIDEFDFICFTDQVQLRSNVWKIIFITGQDHSPSWLNRKYKMLPHLFLSNYEISIYMDVSIQLLKSPKQLIVQELGNNDMILAQHRLRNCVYDEARECVIFGKSSYINTVSQLRKYKRQGFPVSYGLFENGVLIRRHNSPPLIRLMEEWWEEYNQGYFRDQLSLPPILWKNDMSYPLGTYSINDGEYFKLFPHNTEKLNRWNKVKLSLRIRLRRFYYSFLSFG